MSPKTRHLLFTSAIALLLSGCAVGPEYRRPQVAIPQKWTVTPARGTTTGGVPADEWWSSFQDSELDSLVERAIDRNLDLKLALERVTEARAARGVVRSDYFPRVDAGVSATRIRGGINQGVIRAVPSSADPNARPSLISPFETNSFQGSLGASWELDVFGRTRRSVQAATADLAAAEENRRDVLVILLGDVGRTYADLRGFQRRLEIANENIAAQQDTLDLTTARARAGLATELDVSRAAAQQESTKAGVPTLVGGIDVSIHRLSVLLGEEPGALHAELEKSGAIPRAAPRPGEFGPPPARGACCRSRPAVQSCRAAAGHPPSRISAGGSDSPYWRGESRFASEFRPDRHRRTSGDSTSRSHVGGGQLLRRGPGNKPPVVYGRAHSLQHRRAKLTTKSGCDQLPIRHPQGA